MSNDNIKLKHYQTSNMIADMLTKGVERSSNEFKKLRETAGVVPVKDTTQSASERRLFKDSHLLDT